MSEFLAPDAGAGLYQTTEHYLQRVLAGDVENVRTRLLAALDRVGYDLIDDDEFVLRARRGAHGWASSYCSADVLDYPRTLIIRLKATSAHATRATFDYVIKHPSLSRGEVEVLTREAEAITAMAAVRAAGNFCAACGTVTTDDSRFCRKCGAPTTGEETALEVL
ncbi:MAG TPA: zinc ribbon domain-containing protein, partial [Pyrinomonadaceae bacterium]|nr:zinc ribbon domain-containing protein [Pyrinomonadaceae bacterium]